MPSRFQALDQAPLETPWTATRPFATGIGVHLSPEARTIYVTWYNGESGPHRGATVGWWLLRQAADSVARIALILHALWNAEGPRRMLSAERMADAIELGEFFAPTSIASWRCSRRVHPS